MEVFKDYAYYYNLFYNDKNYEAEAKQVSKLINDYKIINVKSILNMGCGTGRHDFAFDKLGYQITGIDMSPEMIEVANKTNKEKGTNISFEVSDIRSYQSNQQFDAVISLFHVMSYQNSNEDLHGAFKAAADAVKVGGIFVFDTWYGPGVLTDKPTVRVRKIESENNTLIRYAKPVMRIEQNVVDVCYEVLIIDETGGTVKSIDEVHHMRYFFIPEMQLMLKEAGFTLKACLDCNTLKKTNFDSWTAYFIAVKERE